MFLYTEIKQKNETFGVGKINIVIIPKEYLNISSFFVQETKSDSEMAGVSINVALSFINVKIA